MRLYDRYNTRDLQMERMYIETRDNSTNKELRDACNNLIKEYAIRKKLMEEILNKAGISLEVLRNGKE